MISTIKLVIAIMILLIIGRILYKIAEFIGSKIKFVEFFKYVINVFRKSDR